MAELKSRVRAGQVKAALSVNRELIALYWDIGRVILQRQHAEGWGAKVVARLAADLRAEFPEMKGFSARNLDYMLAFAEAWGGDVILQQPVARLAVGNVTPPEQQSTGKDSLAGVREYHERRQRVIERRLKAARFPVLKTLEQFRWDWPKRINRMAVQDLFRMEFLKEKSNVVLLGNVGLGKTHLATALGYAACQQGASVLFANAISVINDLSAAQKRGLLKRQLKTYLRPELLALDEIGYLPIDQHGADLLFQVISQRYEQGSIVLTTNKPFKQWPSIFNNDSTIASAVLDRLLHHTQTIVIEGSSYRMKDRENQ